MHIILSTEEDFKELLGTLIFTRAKDWISLITVKILEREVF